MEKQIRIFNTAWHVAHQYELFKIPNTIWFQVINSVRKWGKFRPTPDNLKTVAYYEKDKYDIAVLHVDQQCIDKSFGKSQLFMQLKERVKNDIPIIAINHGTPFWPECFEEEEMIIKMKMLLEGCHVVYNSHRAKEMWEKNGKLGLTSRTIIHGLDPDEWWDKPNKEPIVFTTLSAGGLNRYYNRTLLTSVKEKLKSRGIKHIWVGEEWLSKDFDDYRNFISKGLVYFNPTLESPMPRARTEAMFAGACIVTLANHGAEKFIKQGENGILVPDNPITVADVLEELVNKNYKKCIELGQAGKKTALELFSGERFRDDWTKLIKEVLEYEKEK